MKKSKHCDGYKYCSNLYIYKATVSEKLVSAPPPASNIVIIANIAIIKSLPRRISYNIHKITPVFEIHSLMH